MLNCASSTIPNAEVCADKGPLGAACAYTRDGVDENMSFLKWQNVRVGWFCMDANDFGKYQAFIEDTCARSQSCIDEVTKFVDNLRFK